MQQVDICPAFAQHLSWMGIDIAAAGRRTVDDETRFEPPVMLGDLDLWGDHAGVGAFTYFTPGGRFANADIGRYCSVGPGLQVGMTRHPLDGLTTSPVGYVPDFLNFERHFAFADDDWRRALPARDYDIRPRTRIGNDVWIGASAWLKDGITVGDGAVIGAHAVVTHDVAPYAIVAGNPARVIRMRFPDATVERLLALRWWRYNILELADIDLADLDRALPMLEEIAGTGSVQPYAPAEVNLVDEHRRFGAIRDYLGRQAA